MTFETRKLRKHMSWFKTTNNSSNKGGVHIALESISGDVLNTQLQELEAELVATGLTVKRMEFPSPRAKLHIPAVFETAELLESPEAIAITSCLDRTVSLVNATKTQLESEVILLTGSQLATAAWLATLVSDHTERITLYKWLDELEHKVFVQKRIDLTILLDHDPKHIDLADAVIPPAGWEDRPGPEIEFLRKSYLEAGKLLPNTKIISCERAGLLKPDTDVHNEIWNLVRRIALKK